MAKRLGAKNDPAEACGLGNEFGPWRDFMTMKGPILFGAELTEGLIATPR
jgi:hypothetical protein